MAIMKNSEMKTLNKVWKSMNEMYQRKKLNREEAEILLEFSELMKKFVSDKEKANKKTREYVAEKRKANKNYARPKSK